MSDKQPQYYDMGTFGRLEAGTNVGDKGMADGPLPGGWMVAGGILYAPNQKTELIAAEYGWAAAFLQHKELGPILMNAATNGWTEQKLLTEIRQTDWWAKTEQSKREWLSLKSQDPATAARKISESAQQVRTFVAQLGGKMDNDSIDKFAERALANGWNELELTNALTMELLRDGQRAGVRSGVIGRQMRQSADAMAIPVSDQTLNSWIGQIAKGQATMDDFNNYVRTQAKGLYSALANDIDKGLSVKDLAEPYAQSAARMLGITPEQVDFTNAKWNKALNFVDGKGNRRTMTLAEWEDELRTNKQFGYTKTPEAVTKAYAVADAIAQAFGKV